MTFRFKSIPQKALEHLFCKRFEVVDNVSPEI
ncbi:hypothetical protein ALQ55_200299 [Pseudomonas savastanoi pv. savastanoi]|nr:hypothetical protein ALO78_200301 [Pseudomonas amygdali pv. ciccaronei]RMN62091.1 hypothetical protein ALQ55_200299 [Pseudomonas savastanoi pv. savastanoi]